MIDYINFLTFTPTLFLLPALPPLRRFTPIDASKLSYGAATSGVLLTFFGVWQGLLGFDITNTGESLPVLIGGLKVAFGSSVMGLATSMMINLFFVEADKDEQLTEVTRALDELRKELTRFAETSAEVQSQALFSAIQDLIHELEMGINSETREVMSRFRASVEFLREWQEKYVDEIKSVTDAMDKNAIVTRETSVQLDRTNDVLAELAPVTEQIAASIGWVRPALPSMRRKDRLVDPISKPGVDDEK